MCTSLADFSYKAGGVGFKTQRPDMCNSLAIATDVRSEKRGNRLCYFQTTGGGDFAVLYALTSSLELLRVEFSAIVWKAKERL